MKWSRNQGLMVALALAGSVLLAGCSDQRNMPECGDVFDSRLEKSGYEVLDDGIALHRDTGLKITQCAVGQRMSNFRCRGESLKLTWDEAMAYATEVAEKTGEPWRLPEKGEMPDLLESECINPAANPYIFPDLEVANFWTGSKGLHQDRFRCSVYTYQGRVFCRQARNIPQPFLLVKEY
ncbi:MAG: DUF1566 domain-containing protein [Luminiphilus sp.]|nr:DUF1566 domain-containing protein [Luminiphilus sp.]